MTVKRWSTGSEAETIGEFDQENVVRINVEEAPGILPQVETAVAQDIVSLAGPDEVDGRSGPVLPADDQVGVEIPDVEVRGVEGIIRRSVRVLIDLIEILPCVESDLGPVKKDVTIIEIIRHRIVNIFEFIVRAG